MLEWRGDLDRMVEAYPTASAKEKKEMVRVLRLSADNRAGLPFQRHMKGTKARSQA